MDDQVATGMGDDEVLDIEDVQGEEAASDVDAGTEAPVADESMGEADDAADAGDESTEAAE